MERKIEKCPFCGVDVTIYAAPNSTVFLADHVKESEECALLMPEVITRARTYDEAVDRWNRRAP